MKLSTAFRAAFWLSVIIAAFRDLTNATSPTLGLLAGAYHAALIYLALDLLAYFVVLGRRTMRATRVVTPARASREASDAAARR